MKWSLIVILIIFAVRFGASEAPETNIPITVYASYDCFPDYVCGDWSDCEEGFQTRVCEDLKCSKKDLIERKLCVEDCKPKIVCSDWSSCTYTEKTNDLLLGEIRFGGYQTRICNDENKCVGSFSEEELCQESFNLDLERIEVCGKKYLAALDPVSGRTVMKISIEDWQKDKLDIEFSQGEGEYCPECYNGEKDTNEEGIDCGGECKACNPESEIKVTGGSVIFWVGFLVFSSLFFKEVILER